MGSRTYFWQYSKGPYKELVRLHAQCFIEAIAHNFYRSPGIIMRCS
ncbi:MAG: hypothetical protein ACMUEL_01670 [Flavobacteriales bacterium Tduv]